MPEEQVRQLGIIADFDELRGHAQLRFPAFFCSDRRALRAQSAQDGNDKFTKYCLYTGL